MIDRQKTIPSLRAVTVPERATSQKARESWQLWGIISEFVEAAERLSEVRPAVSIFGSARTPRDAPLYEQAAEPSPRPSPPGLARVTAGGRRRSDAGNK